MQETRTGWRQPCLLEISVVGKSGIFSDACLPSGRWAGNLVRVLGLGAFFCRDAARTQFGIREAGKDSGRENTKNVTTLP